MANDMVYSSIPPALPVMAAKYGFSAAALGLIPSTYMVTASFLQMLVGYIYDRRPVTILMPLGLVMGGLAIASLGFLDNYFLILAVAVAGGVGSALFHPIATSLSSVSGNRSISVSVFMVGGYLGLAFGAIISAVTITVWGLTGTLTFLPVLLAAAALAMLFSGKTAGSGGISRLSGAVKSVGYRMLSILVVAAVLRSVAVTSIITYLPLYLTMHGYVLVGAGGLLTLFLLTGTVGMILAGVISERLGRMRVVSAMLAVSGLLILALAALPLQSAFVIVPLMGFTIHSVHPLLVAQSHELLPNNLGFASAMMYGFAIGVANVLVPIVGKGIDIYEYRQVFYFLTTLPLAAAILTTRLAILSKTIQAKQQL
jgi:FSR family fosmidomycin resistance protein-like MFS transporter